ncbi:DUF1059 domain-containing protein [Halogeometricum borinquense]|uniref:DUF1059 domain-containing protein n=1 Tax=Halogeometricum borinquense TaxID=60847 RepID=A0A6C0ULW7_9EURY|nr:DUF1059 domain-containing protein [Halogeometricum borinquense]
MLRKVSCQDSGYDCKFVVQSENVDELVEMVQMHAEGTHDMQVSEAEVRSLAVDA